MRSQASHTFGLSPALSIHALAFPEETSYTDGKSSQPLVFCRDFKDTLEAHTDDLMKEVGRYFYGAFYDDWYRTHACLPSPHDVDTKLAEILPGLQTICNKIPPSLPPENPATEVTTAFSPQPFGSPDARSQIAQALHLLLLPPH